MSLGLLAVLLLAICLAGGIFLGVWVVRSFAPRAGIAGLAPTGALFLLGVVLVWIGASASGEGSLALVPGIAFVAIGLAGLFGCALRGATRAETNQEGARDR